MTLNCIFSPQTSDVICNTPGSLQAEPWAAQMARAASTREPQTFPLLVWKVLTAAYNNWEHSLVITLTRILNVCLFVCFVIFSASVNGQILDHGINHLPFFLITPLCYQKQTNRRESKTLSNGYWFKTPQTISMCIAFTVYRKSLFSFAPLATPVKHSLLVFWFGSDNSEV